MIQAVRENGDHVAMFSNVNVGAAALGCVAAGEGKPLIYLTPATSDAPTRFHELLADQLRLFIVSLSTADVDARAFGDIMAALGLSETAILCRGKAAQAALNFARDRPDAVSQLVLIAPEVEVADALRAVQRPVLVLESSRSSEEVSVGQKLTAIIPECYDVLVYDTTIALDSERPEAVADVVTDFIERSGGFVVGKPRGPIHP